MAGKKAFVPERALDKAMVLFWKQGYEATSITDLTECMGIRRGSLYDTFGDKRSLYLDALKRYIAIGQTRTNTLLAQDGTLQEVLEYFFQDYIDLLLSDPASRGCFLVNASLEMAPHNSEVNKIVSSAFQEIEEAFYVRLTEVSSADDLPSTQDARQLAHFLSATLVSIRVFARTKRDRRVLQDTVKTALSVFD